jgi:hypothetical protein
MIRIEQAAVITPPGKTPPYSSHGYCITPDGTTYALLRQWWHGALLALLFPDKAQEAGYEMPDDPDDLNVFDFQHFELDNHNLFPVIRICAGRLMGPTSIDRGCDPSTPEQIAAVRIVMKELGLSGNDEVSTDHKDMKVREMFDFLISDTEVWGDTPRTVRKHRLVKKGEDAFEVREEALDEDPVTNPEQVVAAPTTNDSKGDELPRSFEEAAGVTKRTERNDE